MKATHRAICAAALLLAGCATSTNSTAAPASAGGASSKAPPVVFISGLGVPVTDLKDFQAKVAEFTTTFAFERPGYSGTPMAPSDADGVRTSDEVAALLEAALKKNGIRRPVILVAHSVGSLYALRYAKLHPRDVAALVLLDGRMKDYTRRCFAAAAAGASIRCAPKPIGPDMPLYRAAESRGFEETERTTPEPGELGNIPVIVISKNKGDQPGLGIWQDSQKAFASGLKNGRFVLAEKSDHYIYHDEPELALREIRAAIDQASRKR